LSNCMTQARSLEANILSEAGKGRFYPTSAIWELGVARATLYRVCERLVRLGLLQKHQDKEYAAEKGREIGLVYYTLKEA